MKRTPLFLAVAAGLVLAGCCGPSIDPILQADTNRFLAEYSGSEKTIKAPKSLDLKPWKVGQWALYKVIDDDGLPGYEKLSVIRKDDCGIWVQMSRQDYYQRSVQHICYTRMPKPPGEVSAAVDDALDMIQVIKTQNGDDPPATIDLRTNPGMKIMMRTMAQSIAAGIYLDGDAPRETITVPAGKFEDAIKMNVAATVLFITVTAQTWNHPDVPINALVKSIASTGMVQELLDYGDKGGEEHAVLIP